MFFFFLSSFVLMLLLSLYMMWNLLGQHNCKRMTLKALFTHLKCERWQPRFSFSRVAIIFFLLRVWSLKTEHWHICDWVIDRKLICHQQLTFLLKKNVSRNYNLNIFKLLRGKSSPVFVVFLNNVSKTWQIGCYEASNELMNAVCIYQQSLSLVCYHFSEFWIFHVLIVGD